MVQKRMYNLVRFPTWLVNFKQLKFQSALLKTILGWRDGLGDETFAIQEEV